MWLYVSALLVMQAAVNPSPKQAGGEELDWRSSAVDRVIKDLSVHRLSDERRKEMAAMILRYSKRWHVDPLLTACVTAGESGFRNNPPPLCRWETVHVGETIVRECRKPKRSTSVGIMQSTPSLRVTTNGFWYCFGSTRKFSRTELLKTDAGFCVGTYELSQRRHWVRTRGRIRPKNPRHGVFLKSLRRRYPKIYTVLVEMFWTAATYNWGPRILRRNRARWDSIGYPIRKLRCYIKYMEMYRPAGKQ